MNIVVEYIANGGVLYNAVATSYLIANCNNIGCSRCPAAHYYSACVEAIYEELEVLKVATLDDLHKVFPEITL